MSAALQGGSGHPGNSARRNLDPTRSQTGSRLRRCPKLWKKDGAPFGHEDDCRALVFV
jgi:hypothetical protein